jgi:hypothetical protein
MFGFGLQARTAECVRRGGQALFLGTYIDQQAITRMPLSEEAQAALYYYTAAICLHDFFQQMKASSLSGQKPWATIDFFMENVLAGIERFERERHLPKGALAGHCIAPLAQIGEYVEQGGTVPVQFAAAEVQVIHEGKLSYTSHQDAEPIREFMAASKEKFHADTQHMFT